MKLAAFRDKDRVHLRDLVFVGLVDESWLPGLSTPPCANVSPSSCPRQRDDWEARRKEFRSGSHIGGRDRLTIRLRVRALGG